MHTLHPQISYGAQELVPQEIEDCLSLEDRFHEKKAWISGLKATPTGRLPSLQRRVYKQMRLMFSHISTTSTESLSTQSFERLQFYSCVAYIHASSRRVGRRQKCVYIFRDPRTPSKERSRFVQEHDRFFNLDISDKSARSHTRSRYKYNKRDQASRGGEAVWYER
jgi:hypothetical protein